MSAVTFGGTAQLDTAQKMFGSASLLLDGDSDYITIPDSTDWAFRTGNFTIDMRVRFSSYSGSGRYTFYAQENTCNYQFYQNAGELTFYAFDGSTELVNRKCSWTPSTNVWYHIAIVRNGTTCLIFIDGISQTLSGVNDFGTKDLLDDNSDPIIGRLASGGGRFYFPGWIDEVRISKGVARWTSNFTPPIDAYVTTHEITPNILSADTWQEVKLDISAVSDANKDAIDQIIITIVNADAANTFYIDNMYSLNSHKRIISV